MYEKLTPKEYILEERTNEEISSQKSEASPTITNAAEGAAAIEGRGRNHKGLFGGGLGGLFNQIGMEELLLIGLILLLVFEEGEFDIILVLAFLLICGLDF